MENLKLSKYDEPILSNMSLLGIFKTTRLKPDIIFFYYDSFPI